MIETVFALLLILNGSVIEFTYKDKLSSCMKSARIAKKEVNPERVRFVCKRWNGSRAINKPNPTNQVRTLSARA